MKTSLLEECPANSEANHEWDEKEHSIKDSIAACECCIAVSHVLHSTFESAHKKLPDTMKRLSYADIIDVTGKKSRHFKNRIYMFLKIENYYLTIYVAIFVCIYVLHYSTVEYSTV